ncbi:hypothetical protein [Paenibacillus donghaensis]|nr:hypothetical protein [Paenibacillus donghaensis]
MNYEPAELDDEALSKLREYEQQLSQAAGLPVVLVAYSDDPEE